MPNDEYDILPRNSIERLKADLDNLKAKTNEMSSDSGNREVIGSINELKTSINNLMGLFSTAAEEMKMEEAEHVGVEKKLGPLSRKLDTLIDQNQEIAKGLVVIADMIKEHFPKIEEEIDSWSKKKTSWRDEEKEEEPKFIDIPTKRPKVDAPQQMTSQQNSSAQSTQPQSFQQQNQQPFQQQGQQQNQQSFGSLGPMPDFTQQSQPMQNFGQSNQQSFNFGSDLPPLSAPDPFPSLNDTQPKKKGLFDKLLGK